MTNSYSRGDAGVLSKKLERMRHSRRIPVDAALMLLAGGVNHRQRCLGSAFGREWSAFWTNQTASIVTRRKTAEH